MENTELKPDNPHSRPHSGTGCPSNTLSLV